MCAIHVFVQCLRYAHVRALLSGAHDAMEQPMERAAEQNIAGHEDVLVLGPRSSLGAR